ncbi:hypothetical protein ZIOFF_039802 [Zingiber officinale]|uniref:TMEM205-like domain-containing protein n=1 Tax=Zingiber officinale TaxID=94328 RepID=A0A8J5KUK7_ZINOF|nr:hypothetical protein ZIOFF_039802 [Zingiber officinale]
MKAKRPPHPQIDEMMNLVSLGLLLSSLAAAGVWSPHPEAKPSLHPTPDDNDRILREGHRFIVVEYERLQVDDSSSTPHRLVDDTSDKTHQPKASVLPTAEQAESSSQPQASASAKNLICDAYGVCKEKVSSLIGKGKEKASEKAEEFEETAKETLKKFDEKASELKENAKSTVRDAAQKPEQVKDAVKETTSTAKESAKKVVESSMDKAKDAGWELAQNVSELGHKIEHKAEKTAEEVRGNLTDILCRAKGVAFDAAAYLWALETGKATAAILHLLGFATAYGTCIWVTFVSSNVLAASLPRQQFGTVQSKLYPMYFRVVAHSIALALAAHFLGRDRRILAERLQTYNLLAALAMVTANMLFLEPRATKVMFQRMKVEKGEGRGRDMADVISSEPAAKSIKETPVAAAASKVVGGEQGGVKSELVQLNGRLRRLNNHSSFLNILTLMSLSWHLVHLARQLQQQRC